MKLYKVSIKGTIKNWRNIVSYMAEGDCPFISQVRS